MTVGIIGGGAAGLAAAVTAARAGASVTVFERRPRVGKKLSATGNGRCNITNTLASPANYHSVSNGRGGENAAFTGAVLSAFTPADTADFFRGLGLHLTEEDGGRVYPCSSMAVSVVDVLRFAADALGVETLTDCEVQAAARDGKGFLVRAGEGSRRFDRLIIACGGKASPQLGGTDLGCKLLKSFGHSVTPLKEALVPLVIANNATRALKGIRAEAKVSVLSRGETVAVTYGEVQFTDDGLSGIPVLDISRAAADAPDAAVALDFAPDETGTTLLALLRDRVTLCPALTAADLCTGLVQNRLGRVIVKAAGITAETPLNALTEGDLATVVSIIKSYAFPVARAAGFDRAQVTAGGAPLKEFSSKTMQSKLVPGLFAAGEVLDCHGDCGGFNLQWAWSTGILAGRAAAEVKR